MSQEKNRSLSNTISRNVIVPDLYAGQRIDKVLCQLFSDYSRSQLQRWLKQGKILVNDSKKQAKKRVVGGEKIYLNVILESLNIWQAQPIPLDIIHEDDDIIVINKPDNLVVHPGAGNLSDTLFNGLLFYNRGLYSVPRAGIVHRLDKDTSGLMVVAKNLIAHTSLVRQLSLHQVTREYEAIVTGCIYHDRTIKTKMARNPRNRLKMAVTLMGKTAITHVKILDNYRLHTRLRCFLETGKTHQIRVHMHYINNPLLGDPLYNSRYKTSRLLPKALQKILKSFRRQALHSYKLSFFHPTTLKPMCFKKEPPYDMRILKQALKNDTN